MIKLKVIACDVLNREISYLSSLSSCFIDTAFLHQGLHDTANEVLVVPPGKTIKQSYSLDIVKYL